MARFIRLTALALCGVLALTMMLSRQAAAQQGSDSGVLQMGAELYVQNCLACHGEEGEGRVGATLSKNWPSIRPDLTIKNVIVNGVAGSPMPAWGQDKGGPLTTEQIDALVAYILTWETGEPYQYQPITPTQRPVLTPPAEIAGDPNKGAVLYDENCAMCHGANGEGRVGVRLAKNWPSIRPDLNVRNVIINGVSGSPMPAWGQEQGGPLSEQNINDLTAFILSLPPAPSGQEIIPTSRVEPMTPASSAMGAILTIVLFVAVILGILLVQRKKS